LSNWQKSRRLVEGAATRREEFHLDYGQLRRQFPTRGDKAILAQSIRARMAMEGLYLPSQAPWLGDLQRELITFPAAMHDGVSEKPFLRYLASLVPWRTRRCRRRIPCQRLIWTARADEDSGDALANYMRVP
jgi:hypothetical protein